MDTDSPADRIDDEDDDEEPSYNADLLELEPLREDSDDLLDDGNGDDKAQRSSPEDGDENSNEKSSEEDDDDDDEDDDEEEDTHVQGLTSNEREILTLLAVDKKLASLLELAADALSALRPKEESDNVHSNDGESAVQAKEASKEVKAVSPSQAFEKAASEYYKAVDDIQLTLRNSIHLIRKARISPRTLMENPAMGSVLAGGSGSNIATTDANTAVNIAPGVVPSKNAGLSRGAQRMELETYKSGIRALKSFLESHDRPIVHNGQNHARQDSVDGQ